MSDQLKELSATLPMLAGIFVLLCLAILLLWAALFDTIELIRS